VHEDSANWLIVRLYAAGCAPGWNAAMRYMAYHDDIPWAVVVNSDIYAPPGTPTPAP
jgi:hypothetical protein